MDEDLKDNSGANASLALSEFMFGELAVRTIILDDMPWFVANDVCAVLEIKNSRDALTELDDDEKVVVSTDTIRGLQKTNAVNESGLYNLIFRSRKPAAKRFLKWVTRDVLPQIRRTGQYQQSTTDQIAPDPTAQALWLKAERSHGQKVALVVIEALSVLDSYFTGLTNIAAIIERSKDAAHTFDVETITHENQACPHCRNLPSQALSENAVDSAQLLAARARELSIEWRRLQPRLDRIHAMFKTHGSAASVVFDYLEVVRLNREAQTSPKKH